MLSKSAIGKRIRRCRESLNMSRSELGRRVGVTSHTIANIEYGDKGTTIDNLYRITKILGVSMDWLLEGDRYYGSDEDAERQALYENIIALLSVCSIEQLKCMESIVRLFIKGVVKNV